jgi:hypothetical protein
MPKVIIDMTMSLDGYVAGPEDGPEFPLGKQDGMAIFDWYFPGTEEYRTPLRSSSISRRTFTGSLDSPMISPGGRKRQGHGVLPPRSRPHG